jgi:hypothetical protein
MVTKIASALMVVCMLVLAGCQTPEPVTIVKTTPVLPPDDFLIDCDMAPPPDLELYLSLSDSDKEQMLVDTYNTATSFAIVCNVRNGKLRQWKIEQQKLFTTTNGGGSK